MTRSQSEPELRDYQRALEGTLGIPFTAGNHIEPLVNVGKDDEIALCIIDSPTFDKLAADFEQDRGQCSQVDLQTWRQRGLWQRGKELVARLLSPQA